MPFNPHVGVLTPRIVGNYFCGLALVSILIRVITGYVPVVMSSTNLGDHAIDDECRALIMHNQIELNRAGNRDSSFKVTGFDAFNTKRFNHPLLATQLKSVV